MKAVLFAWERYVRVRAGRRAQTLHWYQLAVRHCYRLAFECIVFAAAEAMASTGSHSHATLLGLLYRPGVRRSPANDRLLQRRMFRLNDRLSLVSAWAHWIHWTEQVLDELQEDFH
jgi:hypothetical protein